MSLVSFVELQNTKQFKQSILNSLELIDYKFPKNIKNVTIKPNMCYYWDHTTGQTTDPRFVAELIKILRERISPDIEISIIESDASAMRCKYAFKFLGYDKIAKEYGVKLVNLSEDESEDVETTVGGKPVYLKLANTLKNADLKINVPKIKYIAHTKISCAQKNIFGCIPEPKKFKYHSNIDEIIVALNKIMRFDLCLLEGLIVLGNVPKKLGLVMASQDSVAFDCAAADLLCVKPESIRHIMLAEAEGLGKALYVAKGTDPSYFIKRYPRKSFKDKLLFAGYRFAVSTGLLNESLI